MNRRSLKALVMLFALTDLHPSNRGCCVFSFTQASYIRRIHGQSSRFTLWASSLSSRKMLSPLPSGLSPFEKSVAKNIDIQSNFRGIAAKAIARAISDKCMLLEIEFPELVGGERSKTQFDDFDNIQELDANRDWCTQLSPSLSGNSGRTTWLVFPDDKECELAKKEWGGQRYRSSAKFTSIRAACNCVIGQAQTKKAWGSRFAESMNRLTGGDGVLADSRTLDQLDPSVPRLHLVCQPGNGGPVEDWINVECLHKADPSQITCVVNGALDKVRDGYYPSLFFPALASTIPFYKSFEVTFFLKPLTDKGLYGWIYRVYPEPWQVILQSAKPTTRDGKEQLIIEDAVALVSPIRPTYAEAVRALSDAASRSDKSKR